MQCLHIKVILTSSDRKAILSVLLFALMWMGPLDLQGGAPLCALDVFTDSQEYVAPGPPVKIQMFLQVAETVAIQNAKLIVQIDQQDGTNLSVQSQPTINLEGSFQWQGVIYTLDISQDIFGVTGSYRVYAQLQGPDGTILCEGTTGFVVRSLWGQNPRTKTLLVTSPRQEFTEPFVVKLATWLEAYYQTTVRVIHQQGLFQEYRADMYQGYDVILYYGLDPNQSPPQSFIDDVFHGEGITKKKVVWIGYQLERAQTEAEQAVGVALDRTIPSQLRELIYLYSDTAYTLQNNALMLAKISNPQLARARAVITEDGQPVPLVVSAKHADHPDDGEYFYFVGFHPTAFLSPFGAHLVFLDVLNEVYGIDRGQIALIRLEDIHAKTQRSDLLSVVGYLGDAQVPFSLAVIPVFADAGGVRARLSTDSDFRLMVKQALLKGGEVVVHGLTHQNRGETAVDFEFWDPQRGMPIGDAEYARRRVLEALTEISLAGLAQSVVAWETPHYAAGDEAYQVFEQFFAVIYEDPTRWGLDLEIVPFVVELKNNLYVPTDLGFVQAESADEDIQRILARARLLAGLKYGALASFFYHPVLGVDRLGQLIEGLKGQGWSFMNLSAYLSRLGLAPKTFIKQQ